MDLSTTYLGLKLKNPIVSAASPLSKEVDSAKRLEDAGVAAIVMYSLFEEQIKHEQKELDYFLTHDSNSFAEALSYFPEPDQFFDINAESYLQNLQKIKSSVGIPVIGSLNGVSEGGWTEYAKRMEEAGADAIELNIYYVPTDPELSSAKIEQMYVDDLKAVKKAVKVPVAVKLSPFFSAMANMARQLESAGADGLVLFNRFFAPDIDLDTLEVDRNLELSTPSEMRLPLRWIAILRGKVGVSLAASSGIHSAGDAIKLLLAGADVTMLASTVLKNGTAYAEKMLFEIKQWMEEKEYESVSQMRGSMSYESIAEPAAYERANYMKMLQSFSGSAAN